MEIDATLVVGGRVHEIIGEPCNCRKLMSFGWIEIGVPTAGINGTVPKPEVGQACRVIITNRNISGNVGHEIIDPVVPLQRRLRVQVAETRYGIADIVGSEQAERGQRGRKSSRNVSI